MKFRAKGSAEVKKQMVGLRMIGHKEHELTKKNSFRTAGEKPTTPISSATDEVVAYIAYWITLPHKEEICVRETHMY